jgi:hypothetical protein
VEAHHLLRFGVTVASSMSASSLASDSLVARSFLLPAPRLITRIIM